MRHVESGSLGGAYRLSGRLELYGGTGVAHVHFDRGAARASGISPFGARARCLGSDPSALITWPHVHLLWLHVRLPGAIVRCPGRMPGF